jgi:diacylglycerol kinase (ATP)
MKLAPKAKINDGLIDLMLIRTSNPLELAQIFMNLYDGSHVDLPTVEYIQVKRFSLVPYPPNCSKIEDESNFEPEEYEEIIDIDGELKGVTPFDCTVFPKSINIVL